MRFIKRTNEYYDNIPEAGDVILHKINDDFDDDDGALVISSEFVRRDSWFGKLYRIVILTTEGKISQRAIMHDGIMAPCCFSVESL